MFVSYNCGLHYNYENERLPTHNLSRQAEHLEGEKPAKIPPTKSPNAGDNEEAAETNDKARKEDHFDPENTSLEKHDLPDSHSKNTIDCESNVNRL